MSKSIIMSVDCIARTCFCIAEASCIFIKQVENVQKVNLEELEYYRLE